MAATTHPLESGTMLAGGRFEVLAAFGGSETAYLYRARETEGGHEVVLQIFTGFAEVGPLDDELGSFELAGLIPALEGGTIDELGQAYVVYDRQEGRPLAVKLGASPLAPHDGARLIRDVARIAATMHDRGAFHGWLGLDSIVVGRDRARLLNPALSPARVPDQDPLVDVRALASVLHHVLHGEPYGASASPSMRNDLPQELTDLVARGMSGRIETMREFSNRLDRILDDTTEAAGELVLPLTETGTMVGYRTTSTKSGAPVLARKGQTVRAGLRQVVDTIDFSPEMWEDDFVDEADDPTIIGGHDMHLRNLQPKATEKVPRAPDPRKMSSTGTVVVKSAKPRRNKTLAIAGTLAVVLGLGALAFGIAFKFAGSTQAVTQAP